MNLVPIAPYLASKCLLTCKRDGQKFASCALVRFVLGIFSGRDQFGEPRRPLEEGNVEERTSTGPTEVGICLKAGPQVHSNPDSDFARKVRMPVQRQ